MTKEDIQKVSEKVFGEFPLEIQRKTIGMCNEVYEMKYSSQSYIIRMNKVKELIYGTHKHLPLFKKLSIKTPDIIAEDYSKTVFPFCYQVQNKIEGEDLGLVIQQLSSDQLKGIASEISDIFDKFNSLEDFGGLDEYKNRQGESPLKGLESRRTSILERNEHSKVLDQEILDINDHLLESYKDYFRQLSPRLFYDDISAKNVMIHEGKFNGLVDLDFLSVGDYLDAIGAIIACWYGEEAGDLYVNEIIRLQELDDYHQQLVKVYAIFHLILWTSEEGVRFNSNATGEINWEKVEAKRRKIIGLYQTIIE